MQKIPYTIPPRDFIPFSNWCLPDNCNQFLYPELNISAKEMTLITGEGDLTALTFDIVWRCVNLYSGKLLYLHSDNFPEHSSFPDFL